MFICLYVCILLFYYFIVLYYSNINQIKMFLFYLLNLQFFSKGTSVAYLDFSSKSNPSNATISLKVTVSSISAYEQYTLEF